MPRYPWLLYPLRIYSHFAITERGGYRLTRFFRSLIPKKYWKGRFNCFANILMDLDLSIYPDCSMAVGLYELDTVRLLRRIAKPGMRFLDVGANIGYISLMAQSCRKLGLCIDAVEPDPLNLVRLENNLRLNGLEGKIKIYRYAASDSPGEVNLWHPQGEGTSHGMSSIVCSHWNSTSMHLVKAVRLDEIITEAPDIVKMDIEGAELMAVKGMSKWLDVKFPPMLIVEHNQHTALAGNWKCGDILRFLQDLNPNWRAAFIGWRLIKLSGPDQIDDWTRQGNLFYFCPEY